MLSPKRTKFRKYQKGRVKGIFCRGTSSNKNANLGNLSFGRFGLQSLECGRLSSRVLEAARRAMSRQMKRKGQIWMRVFPDIPVTAKPVEVRMGKGKGSVDFWVARVKKGQVLFELDRVPKRLARYALYKAAQKLPVLAKFTSSL